jgi:DNA-binding response OmpR family regulator
LARGRLPRLDPCQAGDSAQAVATSDPAPSQSINLIFLSSTHWNEASRTLGLQLGAFRYLLRPLEPAVLLAEIEGCLSRH